jgi:uncharacterized membrane protein required for colicin V production
MDQTAFLTGLVGSLVGALGIAGAVMLAYYLETRQRKQAIKAASAEINGLINEIKGLNRSPAKSSGKFN